MSNMSIAPPLQDIPQDRVGNEQLFAAVQNEHDLRQNFTNIQVRTFLFKKYFFGEFGKFLNYDKLEAELSCYTGLHFTDCVKIVRFFTNCYFDFGSLEYNGNWKKAFIDCPKFFVY